MYGVDKGRLATLQKSPQTTSRNICLNNTWRKNVSDDGQIIRDALAELAEISSRSLDFRILLLSQVGASNVSGAVSVVRRRGESISPRQSEVWVEWYVEAELSESTTVCWMLEAIFDPSRWRIDRSIHFNKPEPYKAIHEFPGLHFSSVGAMLTELKPAVEELFKFSFSLEEWKFPP